MLGADDLGIGVNLADAILNATRNDALQVLSASIVSAVNWTTQYKQRARALPRNPMPDHVLVYDAIAAGDGVAEAARKKRSELQVATKDLEEAAVEAEIPLDAAVARAEESAAALDAARGDR